MKRAIILSAALILIVLIGLVAVIAVINYTSKPFYVGVTFGGDTAAEAKQLIDRVKNYTNLFVIQSSPLQNNLTAMEEVCDYAVNAGLNIITYFSSFESQAAASFINTAQTRWGSHFLGLYYSDEPGGRMLDFGMPLYDASAGKQITKQTGYYTVNKDTFTFLTFFDSGIIMKNSGNSTLQYTATYYPNGTISYYLSRGNFRLLFYQPDGTVEDINGKLVTDAGSISQFEPYSDLWESRPIKNYLDAAYFYVATQQNTLGSLSNQSSAKLFTSDYALYWWDYQGGYDTVFAELGWNNTAAQEIGLVRGAANLQGKSWGTIITWTYTQAPYLTSGDEMYEQMKTSYECGAQYVLIFNYAENMTGPYGTLQDEHFQALERFWNEVVQNPNVVHGGIKAEAALVLPKDFGWGMRNQYDTIWGLWNADSTSQQIWTQLQSKLAQYGSKLDIVYDDPAHPVAGKYNKIYFWNQTS